MYITSYFKYLNKDNVLRSLLLTTVALGLDYAVLAQGKYTEYKYDNGVISSAGYLLDGKPDGYWKTFYPNGNIKSEGNRSDFQLDSLWVFYAENGEKKSVSEYKNGKKNGVTDIYQNGVLKTREYYSNDRRVNEYVEYYPTGEVLRRIPIEEGKESGSGFEYALDGRVISLIEYADGYLKRIDKVNREDTNGNKRGPWVSFHANGVISMEGYFMNDKKNGVFKTYDTRGDLKTLEKYRDDVLVRDSEESIILDIRNTFYSDGTVKSSGGYVDGKKEGTHRIYDEEGEIASGQIFDRGTLTGEGLVDRPGNFQGDWKLYFESGELLAKGAYLNSERTGEWVFYFKNGKIEHRGKYDEGLPQGDWKWYHPNGVLRRNDYYRRGKEDGHSLEQDEDGNIISEGEYVNGYREGQWFYHVGDHTEKGAYLDGERQGEWIYEYPGGQLNFKGEYIAGLETGKHKWYHPNGQLKKEGKYSSGLRVGNWATYSEDGAKTLEVKYKNGKEIKINGSKVIVADGTDKDDEEVL